MHVGEIAAPAQMAKFTRAISTRSGQSLGLTTDDNGNFMTPQGTVDHAVAHFFPGSYEVPDPRPNKPNSSLNSNLSTILENSSVEHVAVGTENMLDNISVVPPNAETPLRDPDSSPDPRNKSSTPSRPAFGLVKGVSRNLFLSPIQETVEVGSPPPLPAPAAIRDLFPDGDGPSKSKTSLKLTPRKKNKKKKKVYSSYWHKTNYLPLLTLFWA